MAKKGLFDNLKSAFKNIDIATEVGIKRALTKSATTTRSRINRDIRQESGLKSSYINTRLKLNRPAPGLKNKHSFSASVGIANRALIPLRVFNPKPKKVKTARGIRQGVTIKQGKGSRKLVPHAFLMDVGATTIVAERKTFKRYPTKESMVWVWQEIVGKTKKTWAKFFVNEFARIKEREIQGVLKQRFNVKSNDGD